VRQEGNSRTKSSPLRSWTGPAPQLARSGGDEHADFSRTSQADLRRSERFESFDHVHRLAREGRRARAHLSAHVPASANLGRARSSSATSFAASPKIFEREEIDEIPEMMLGMLVVYGWIRFTFGREVEKAHRTLTRRSRMP
jgi:hypothetical protein